MKTRLLSYCLTLWLGTALGALTAPPAAAAADAVPSIGYVDPFGGWYLRSLFPLFQEAFEKPGGRIGAVDLKSAASAAALWDIISPYEVLLLSDWELAEKHPRVFRKYLSAGGGLLVVTPYSGLRDRQDLVGALPYPLRWLGISPSAQGIQDPKTDFGAYWWTRRISPHAVTDDVKCLAFPKQGDYGRVATQKVALSRHWEVLVKAEETARVFAVRFTHTSWFPAWEDSGEDGAQPPLFAVRKALNGRIAFLPVDPGYVLWNVGNPAFPQVFMELGDEKANRSDGFRLIANTLRWLAEPARSRGWLGQTAPETEQSEPFRFPERVAPVAAPPEAPPAPQFRGLIGVRSDLSDGKASVAEYAAEARRLGLSFIFFAEPWEALDEAELAQLRATCKAASDDSFRAIPGIQYADTSGISWVYLDPAFLPTEDYLDPGTKLVKFDGRFAYNQWMKSGHLTRLPLGISRIKSDPRGLWWYHFLPVWEWRDGRLDGDNQEVFLRNIGNGLSYVPCFYADIGDLTAMRNAVGQAAMVVAGANLGEAMAKIVSYAPWPLYEDNFSYVSQGPTISQFEVAGWNGSGRHMVKTAGAQTFAVRLSASSEAGLEEVALLGNGSLVHHRFLPRGAKRFSTGFSGVMDRQYSLVLRVKDRDGKLAYSTPHLAYTNTAGIYYCGDNLNTLQNANTSYYHPARQEFPGAPPNWPPYFYGWRGWDGLQNMVKQAYLQVPYASVNSSEGGELTPGDRYERPMELVLASYFCNVFRSQSTRAVRYSFPENTNESAAAVPVGDTRYADQELLSIIPSCRAGLEYFWHRPAHADQAFEGYRGSVALMEGRLRFKAEVALSEAVQPIPVALAATWSTAIDQVTKYEPEGGLTVTQPVVWKADKLAPGGVLAAGPLLGAPFLANLGDAPLQVEISPQETAGRLGGFSVGMAEPKQRVAAGTEMRFRVLSGFLDDARPYGQAAQDLARSLNLAGGVSGYPLAVRIGSLVDTRFMLTLQAEGYEARWTAGPRRMVIDLPVRLRGVQGNGCIAFFERGLNHFVFVPAVDDDALFQVAIDVGVDVWCGNVFVSDQPALRLTLIGADEGDPRLEVHNPTDEPLRARLLSPAHTPRFGGWSGEVEVPAGSSEVVSVVPR